MGFFLPVLSIRNISYLRSKLKFTFPNREIKVEELPASVRNIKLMCSWIALKQTQAMSVCLAVTGVLPSPWVILNYTGDICPKHLVRISPGTNLKIIWPPY